MKFVRIILLILSFFVAEECAAQILLEPQDENASSQESLTSMVETGYLDGDTLIDSLYYSFADESIVISLSSHDYRKLSFPYTVYSMWTKIGVTESGNGFYIHEAYMRSTTIYSLEYEEETGRFRFAGLDNDYLGPATNDGSGYYSIDLISGDFEAEWGYWDPVREELFPMPKIESNFKIAPMYMDSEEIDFYIPIDSLFRTYKKRAIIENRISDISDDFLSSSNFALSVRKKYLEANLDTLLSEHGIEMGLNGDGKFNIKDLFSDDYSSIACKINIDKRNTLVIVSFDIDRDKNYALIYYDKKTLLYSWSLCSFASTGPSTVHIAINCKKQNIVEVTQLNEGGVIKRYAFRLNPEISKIEMY